MKTTLLLKPCDHCQKLFRQARPLQNVCGPVCANRRVQAAKKAAKALAVAQRKKDKARLEELSPQRRRARKKKAAQDNFNKFIQARDQGQPCISCKVTNPPMTPGGQWDAGHFLSRGAYPELAYTESNVHRQCKSCNAGSGKFSHKARTVSDKFEANLRERIGNEIVDWLKGPHEPLHYSEEDYEEISRIYRAKLKELQK